ncbi:hypothetical protein LJC57_08255 [Parabacteroides sp. OttesenSCG-928-G07]|nr:hypothetical protein [Parabacteroides sp. OttesenSCG-928-G21]MDL2278568.1 hypothetical protein [Parabacteroides sp. OttesenSCG-928-G07]
MDKDNNLGRLLVLLFFVLALSLAMYALPDELLGYRIKKVDMLSDIRVKTKPLLRDSLRQLLNQPEIITIDTIVASHPEVTTIDSAAILQKREELYRDMYADQIADSSIIFIDDYSPGHVALRRFFYALNKRDEMDRPVRIAFLGDSFIEGDILVSDFRSGLQKQFGGRGVGFVPISSVTAEYRPTIEQQAEGWKTLSLLNDSLHQYQYTLSCELFEPEADIVQLRFKNTNRYAELPVVSTIKLLYEQNKHTRMQLVLNEGEDQIKRTLPATDKITQNIHTGEIREASYRFTQTDGFRALGVALEDDTGVIVDNFAIRGNSGLILEQLDEQRSKELQRIRPYDLIVLQYGLNTVHEEMLDYGWYGVRMQRVIRHLRKCFPETDILLLSVSDRGAQEEDGIETMPAVFAMLYTQRQIAQKTGVAFWNMFEAMGGENSIVDYVEKGWAGKDYTHMSFSGGREIAKALLEALQKEKEFYDKAEESIH